MTILYGDTGLASVGTSKTFDISLAVNETLLAPGSEIALPTAEPAGGAAGSVRILFQNSDLPTITPTPYGVKYTAILILAGKNTTAGALTISYSVYKNGVSVLGTTTQSVPANQFWTHSHFRFYDVIPGVDTVEARVWCASAGLNLDYYSLVVYPTRIELTKDSVVQDLSFIGTNYTSTKGTPGGANNGSWNMYLTSSSSLFPTLLTSNLSFPIVSINSNANGYVGRVSNGDVTLSTTAAANATFRPNLAKNWYPTTISFREVSR